WEFVAGPLHAGTFGPNKLDNTFGPQVKFLSIPNDLKPNRPPSDGLQFFGMVKINGQDEVMTVSLHNLRGEKVYGIDYRQRDRSPTCCARPSLVTLQGQFHLSLRWTE